MKFKFYPPLTSNEINEINDGKTYRHVPTYQVYVGYLANIEESIVTPSKNLYRVGVISDLYECFSKILD